MTDNSDNMRNYFKDRTTGVSYCKMTLRNCSADCRGCNIPVYFKLKKIEEKLSIEGEEQK